MILRDAGQLAEILCIEETRVVARDNTVSYNRLSLQLPQSPVRAHFVKAKVKVRKYPGGSLAVFHGPRLLARYNVEGQPIDRSSLRAAAWPASTRWPSVLWIGGSRSSAPDHQAQADN
ncbi:MAG: hypothetical protein GY798_17280 [Hyphomicrobiales bacterium]|nr:hypothetical protein [Hyphomicrobiales bacterium]